MTTIPFDSEPRWFRGGLLVLPILIAVISARPYAGSWNDGSRLATVESLVDYGTLAIDDSIFVKVEAGKFPYPADQPGLLASGTSDKLFIEGHFYSDKPAVVSYLMAVPYQIWRWCGMPSFRERPDLVCYFMTLFTSGIVYVFSVWGLYALAIRLRLSPSLRMALVSSFALSTLTLPYVRHVNNHLLLMGVMVGLFLLLVPEPNRPIEWSWGRRLKIGLLLGIDYNLDLGLGPVLVASTLGLLFFRTRTLTVPLSVILFVIPWVGAQLLINYNLGGVWKPVNTVPEYLAWPGSPFTEQNLTGFLRHGPMKLVEYSSLLMVGKQGFIGHNLPLFLLLPAFWYLLRPGQSRLPEMLYGLTFCLGGWGMYSLFSNNYGGACCSIRWFVPFLVPGFYLIAELLKRYPQFRWDFYVLSLWGGVLGLLMWSVGPWTLKMVPLYWPVQIAGLISWAFVYRWRVRQRSPQVIPMTSETTRARAA